MKFDLTALFIVLIRQAGLLVTYMKTRESSFIKRQRTILTLETAFSKIIMVLTSATSTQTPQKSLIQVISEESEELIGWVTSITTPAIELSENLMNLAGTVMMTIKLYKTSEMLLKKSKT